MSTARPHPTRTTQVLGAADPPPVTVRRHGRSRPVVVVCDHASNAIPARLARLGVDERVLARHIAWDLGAAALADALARRLALPCVLAGYSRLVVDCNRDPHGEAGMLAFSDGDMIPGNVGLTPLERTQRIEEIFEPYHRAIDAELQATGSAAPALIAVHTFTPTLNGLDRPWHCGVLWNRDPRLPQPLLAALRAEAGLLVGDNQPYSGRSPANYTIARHAERRRWPHVCIEVRQDLLADAVGVEQWAGRLARALAPRLDDQALYAFWEGA